jgi:type II secretory pathway pseudopilin PulG
MHRRRAFSLVEFNVAMVVLGMAVAGLFPLVVMFTRATKKMEQQVHLGTTCYLVPATDTWAQKLGAPAQITTAPPGDPASAPVLMIDDGETSYVESGTWTTQTSSAASQGQYRWHDAQPGNSPDTASWMFSEIPAGWYQVQVTWPAAAERSTNAGYTVYDGTSQVYTQNVNQRSAPSGATSGGVAWQTLTTAWINGPGAHVTLAARPNGSVAADAAQLVPVLNDVQILTVNQSIIGQDVSAQVQVNVLVPQ